MPGRFQQGETVARGGALEDRMLHQVRSNIRLAEKFVPKKKEAATTRTKIALESCQLSVFSDS
jgi:hypothetical protein